MRKVLIMMMVIIGAQASQGLGATLFSQGASPGISQGQSTGKFIVRFEKDARYAVSEPQCLEGHPEFCLALEMGHSWNCGLEILVQDLQSFQDFAKLDGDKKSRVVTFLRDSAFLAEIYSSRTSATITQVSFVEIQSNHKLSFNCFFEEEFKNDEELLRNVANSLKKRGIKLSKEVKLSSPEAPTRSAELVRIQSH